MKKHVAATLLVLTTLGVLNTHLDIERQDGGYLLGMLGKKHDVLGWLVNASTTALRNCGSVQEHQAGPLHQRVTQAIQAFSPPDSQTGRVLGLRQHGDWLLAEVAFEALNPAVVLLRDQAMEVTIQSQAIWSGTTAPWQAAPLIRRYLGERAPEAPPELLRCFEPVNALFQ